MIIAALCIALGGVSFENVDIPGIYVGAAFPPRGIPTVNFRHADVDADGHMDLLLPTGVYLRPHGQLDPDRFIAMPDIASESRVDVWGSRLYVLSPSLFAAYELQDGTWNQTICFDYEWEPQERYRPEPNDDDPQFEFERFLHDVDGDGQPEIVRADDAGIAIGVVQTDRIETSLLDLYPTSRLSMTVGRDTLWPEADRRVSLPNRGAIIDVVIHEDSAVVVERIPRRGDETIYEIHRYRITTGTERRFALQHAASQRTESLPEHVWPLSLNDDGIVDFFGYEYERPTYESWKPLIQSFISTDSGKTVQVAASRGFKPRSLFVDIDGDGDLDWIGEASGLVNGGIRETANRALFQRKFTHTVMARMQSDDGTFVRKWRTLGRFTIRLDEPARQLTYRFWQYRQGDLFDFTGDFNGNGWRDALVYGTPETVSVYLGGPDGFNTRAETEFAVPPHSVPHAIDIDGDGLSDVAIGKHDRWSPVLVYLNKGSVQ